MSSEQSGAGRSIVRSCCLPQLLVVHSDLLMAAQTVSSPEASHLKLSPCCPVPSDSSHVEDHETVAITHSPLVSQSLTPSRYVTAWCVRSTAHCHSLTTMLLSPSSARQRAAVVTDFTSAEPLASITDPTVNDPTSDGTTLSSVAAHVPFLPLSPSSSSSRPLPPSPSLSAPLSASSYPVVVLRPPSCSSVVLFDPTSHQLTVYERRLPGRTASSIRPPRPLYLTSSSPRSASRSSSPAASSSPSSPSSPASAAVTSALLTLKPQSARQWKKRKHDSGSESLTSGESGSGSSVCPLCRQPWPQSTLSGGRQTYRRHSDSAAVAVSRSSTSSRALQYTVTELDDEQVDYEGQQQQQHDRRSERRANRTTSTVTESGEAAESVGAGIDGDGVLSGVGSVGGGLLPFTSPDYFHLLSYSFLREQAQRQKRLRAVRTGHRPLTAAALLAIDDGGAAAMTATEATDQHHMTLEPSEQQHSPMAGSGEDGDTGAVGVVHRATSLGPARLLPSLLSSASVLDDTGSDSGVDDVSSDARPVSTSPLSVPVIDSSPSDSGGGVGMSGLQSSSFVTGYYDRFFVRVRRLGSGTYGAVYLTCHILEGVELGHYACKIIPVGDSKSWLQRVVAEVRALESVHHRHVVSYRHSWLEMAQVADFGPPVPCLFLLMQYCDLGTVAQLVWPTSDKSTSRGSGPLDNCSGTHLGSLVDVSDKQREQVERIRAKRRSARREPVEGQTDSSIQPPRDTDDEAAAPIQQAGDDVVYLLESDVWWIFLDTCVTGDHMVLTHSGWRSIKRIRVGDVVMSFNVDTQSMEWQPVTRVIATRRNTTAASSKLYRMRGSDMDVVATRDHRLLLGRLTDDQLHIDYATVGDVLESNHNESGTSTVVLTAGLNQQPAVKLVVPGLERVCDWWYDRDQQRGLLQFIGFWLADGRLCHPQRTVVVSQRTLSPHREWLLHLLNEVFPRCWSERDVSRADQRCTTTRHYQIRCPPLFDYLLTMATGPLGYNPLDPSALHNYPHFTTDEQLAYHEQRWYQLHQSCKTQRWTQEDMYAALTGSTVWCTCHACGGMDVCQLACCDAGNRDVGPSPHIDPHCPGGPADRPWLGNDCADVSGNRNGKHVGELTDLVQTVSPASIGDTGTNSNQSEDDAVREWDGDSDGQQSDMDDTDEPVFGSCCHAAQDEETAEDMKRASALMHWSGGRCIVIDRHWFELKRWLGDCNVANVFSRFSRQQAVALLDAVCRAHGNCGGGKYDQDTGRPSGEWTCTTSSAPLINQLQLVAQLTEATVTVSARTQEKLTPLDGQLLLSVPVWQLSLSFSRCHSVSVQCRPLAQPVDVSDDVKGRGNFAHDDDGFVFCIEVESNANFLTQRLSVDVGETAGGGGLRVTAHPVFIGNCLGLRHLHRCGILHMDLKLDNLLLTADRDARGRVQGRRVLLSDMGNAIIKGDAHQRTGNTGTMQYAAPETLLDPHTAQSQRTEATTASPTPKAAASSGTFAYSEKSDLWSLGVCLHCLCYSKLPYEADTPQQLYTAIHSQPLHVPTHPRRSPDLVALITALLNIDPQNRPDCDTILNHPHIRRRREERQSSMQQQSAATHRTDWATQQARTEKTPRHHTSNVADEADAGREQQHQSRNSRRAVVTLRPTAATTAHADQSPQRQHTRAASTDLPPNTHLRSPRTDSNNRKAAQPTDTAHSVESSLTQPVTPRRPSAPVDHSKLPVASSALSLMHSAALTHFPPLQQPALTQPPLSLPLPRLSTAHNGDAVGLVAHYHTSSNADNKIEPVASVHREATKALMPRSRPPATVDGAVPSSTRLSTRCLAALNGVELLGHVCVVSWCAANVSVAPLPLPAAETFAPLFTHWSSVVSQPSLSVVRRACLMLPLVVPFSLCTLSLALSVLLPTELLASLLSASPVLRHCTLSAFGRVCAAAIMCLYTVLLLAGLSALS